MGIQIPVAPLKARDLILSLLMWISVFGLTLLAEKTTLSTGEMAVWPADAITLAFMLGPMRQRPVFALIMCRGASQFLSYFVQFPPLPGTLINAESTIGILTLYLFLHKIDYKEIYFSKNLFVLFAISFIVCMFTAITQSITMFIFLKINIFSVMESCFSANFIAYIALTPLILIIYDQFDIQKNWNYKLLVRITYLVVFSGFSYFTVLSSLPLLFLVPLGLIALTYVTTLGEVACAVLLTGLFTLIATLSGRGEIAATPQSPAMHLLMLQFFLAAITTSILPMAARMAEHKKLREGLMAARLEAEAANSAKSQFLATISHEIRTPLNGVLGMAQIMALGVLDPVQKDRLSIIRRSGEMLLSILNDVLDLSKIEAGKLTIEEFDFDLDELLHGVARTYKPLADEKGLGFSQKFGAPQGLYRGDPTRVRQILNNLISNALKFTEHGQVQVSATFAEDTLRLAVKDSGIGIPPDQLGKLFAKFTQADGSTTRRFGGTGLGLSICRDLAGLMGGTIDVESQEGQGSTFTASIPLYYIGGVDATDLDETATDEAFGAGIKILAAEDNQTNQLVMRTLLEMVGYQVSVVADGAAAVSLWETGDFDVILMDVQMPVMDGPTATRAIRSRESACGRSRTPIIALTANTMTHQVESYRADGMDAHVSKPIDAETLFKAVIEATSRNTSIQAA